MVYTTSQSKAFSHYANLPSYSDLEMTGVPHGLGEASSKILESAGQGAMNYLTGKAAQCGADFMEATLDRAQDTLTGAYKRTANGVVIDKTGPNKKAKTSVQRITRRVTPGHSQISARTTGIGASITQIAGNNFSAPVKLKLGTQLPTPNSIENFLSLFNQSGTVAMSFGGRLTCSQDKRARVYHAFRHMLHLAGARDVGDQYPTGAKILGPSGTLSVVMTGGNAATRTVNHAPIYNVSDGDVYFAPYNLADLEDLSYNLCKFKLGPVGNASDSINFLDDVDRMQNEKHRTNSAIYKNNVLAASYANSGSYASAPYLYDAVFKQGVVDYLFMNKGESPLKLEIIVYKAKHNTSQIPIRFDQYDIEKQLEDVIGEGYVRKVLSDIGTDDVIEDVGDGNQPPVLPLKTDVVTDPSRPFLPTGRFVKQADLGYREHERVKLVLQSGERRPFQLVLGGMKYDPVTQVRRHDQDDTDVGLSMPIINNASYLVAIALSGVPTSRNLSGTSKVDTVGANPTVGGVFGDVYTDSDLQFYGTYTENVGAMSYKYCKTRNIFTNGARPSMTSTLAAYNHGLASSSKIHSTPVTMLPQSQAVRIPAHTTVIDYGTDKASEAQKSTATSANVAQCASGHLETPTS